MARFPIHSLVGVDQDLLFYLRQGVSFYQELTVFSGETRESKAMGAPNRRRRPNRRLDAMCRESGMFAQKLRGAEQFGMRART